MARATRQTRVSEAKRLAKTHGGKLPSPSWLQSHGHASLCRSLYAHPDWYEGIPRADRRPGRKPAAVAPLPPPLPPPLPIPAPTPVQEPERPAERPHRQPPRRFRRRVLAAAVLLVALAGTLNVNTPEPAAHLAQISLAPQPSPLPAPLTADPAPHTATPPAIAQAMVGPHEDDERVVAPLPVPLEVAPCVKPAAAMKPVVAPLPVPLAIAPAAMEAAIMDDLRYESDWCERLRRLVMEPVKPAARIEPTAPAAPPLPIRNPKPAAAPKDNSRRGIFRGRR